MPPAGWLQYLIFALALAGAVALAIALRSVSRRWGAQWSALRAQPRWLQFVAAAAFLWVGLRLARAGWRPLLALLLLIAVFALWGELAARARR